MNQEELFSHFQKFEAYQNQTLSEQATQQFEQELKQNPDLKAVYEAFLLGKWAAWKAGHAQQKAAFKEIWAEIRDEAEIIIPAPGGFRFAQWRWAAAAAVVLLFITSVWLFSSGGTEYPELVETFYERPRASETMGATHESLFSQATQLYTESRYAEAANAFFQYIDSQDAENIAEAQFLLSITYLELGQWAEAERLLNETEYQGEMVDWYLAMLYLKAENPTRLRQQLDQIIGQDGHFFGKKAADLKKELD